MYMHGSELIWSTTFWGTVFIEMGTYFALFIEEVYLNNTKSSDL